MPHDPARPCRPQGGIGLVVLMMMKVMVMVLVVMMISRGLMRRRVNIRNQLGHVAFLLQT